MMVGPSEPSVRSEKGKLGYRSLIAEAIHETMRGARRLGVIDKTTMREFDRLCLATVARRARASRLG
jgi:DNA-binding transcriptional regulator YiaG